MGDLCTDRQSLDLISLLQQEACMVTSLLTVAIWSGFAMQIVHLCRSTRHVQITLNMDPPLYVPCRGGSGWSRYSVLFALCHVLHSWIYLFCVHWSQGVSQLAFSALLEGFNVHQSQGLSFHDIQYLTTFYFMISIPGRNYIKFSLCCLSVQYPSAYLPS